MTHNKSTIMTTPKPTEDIILAHFEQLNLKTKALLYKSICKSLEKDEAKAVDTLINNIKAEVHPDWNFGKSVSCNEFNPEDREWILNISRKYDQYDYYFYFRNFYPFDNTKPPQATFEKHGDGYCGKAIWVDYNKVVSLLGKENIATEYDLLCEENINNDFNIVD